MGQRRRERGVKNGIEEASGRETERRERKEKERQLSSFGCSLQQQPVSLCHHSVASWDQEQGDARFVA